jgi:hypothetical protein
MGACQSTPVNDRDYFTNVAGIIVISEIVTEQQTMYELNYMGYLFQFVRRSNGSTSLRNMRNNERCTMETLKQYEDTIKYVAQHNEYPVVNVQVWHSDHGRQREVRFHFNADQYGFSKLTQILRQHHIKYSELTRRNYIAALMDVVDVEKLKKVLTGSEYQWIDFTTPRDT